MTAAKPARILNSSFIPHHLDRHSPLATAGSSFAAGVTLYAQMKESVEFDAVIRQNLKGLGYGE